MSESLDQVRSVAETGAQKQRAQHLVAVVAGLVRELHPQRFRFLTVEPASRIERDLGIDSLGRTELILRIERAFRVRLPVGTIGEAETVGDLLRALEQAGPARLRAALEAPPAPALPSVPPARDAQVLIEVLEWHAARHPDRLHLSVLQDETTVLGRLTYAELASQARALARSAELPPAALRSAAWRSKSRALPALPSSRAIRPRPRQ